MGLQNIIFCVRTNISENNCRPLNNNVISKSKNYKKNLKDWILLCTLYEFKYIYSVKVLK